MAEPTPKWQSEITKEDFPTAHRPLADLLGVSNALAVLRLYAGEEVYFPKLDGPAGFIEVRNRYCRSAWRKHNAPALAQEMDITIVQLRSIVGDHESQTSLFPRTAR